MNKRTMAATTLAVAIVLVVTPAWAGLPPLPVHGWDPTPWGDPANVAGKNHNHNEAVNLENVLDATNHKYDAMASWYNSVAGNTFNWTSNAPGSNDPDYIGHGYIIPADPVRYQFDTTFLDNAPLEATEPLNDAFDMWQSEINGARGYRNPKCIVGFAWRRAAHEEEYEITVKWLPMSEGEDFVDTNHNGKWDSGETFTDMPDEDGNFNGKYDSYVHAPAWVSRAANPTLNFVDGWYKEGVWFPTNYHFGEDTPTGVRYDFFSTCLHEVGHLVGLDDLYGLYEGPADPFNAFPDSIMGTKWTTGLDAEGKGIAGGVWDPYKRTIDLGSLQGGIDLYSIPVPVPGAAVLGMIGLGIVGAYTRKRRHADAAA